MNASDFVSALAAAAPSIEEYVRAGLSSKGATRFHRSYQCEPRKTPLGIDESNELFTLMNRWNSGTIEIGMVCFADMPEKTPYGTKVGVVEADPLLIHPDDELAVHEFGAPGHVLWVAAKSPNNLMAALSLACKFLADRSVEKISFEDFAAAKATAKQCTTMAGGRRYFDFYCMLLGANG